MDFIISVIRSKSNFIFPKNHKDVFSVLLKVLVRNKIEVSDFYRFICWTATLRLIKYFESSSSKVSYLKTTENVSSLEMYFLFIFLASNLPSAGYYIVRLCASRNFQNKINKIILYFAPWISKKTIRAINKDNDRSQCFVSTLFKFVAAKQNSWVVNSVSLHFATVTCATFLKNCISDRERVIAKCMGNRARMRAI